MADDLTTADTERILDQYRSPRVRDAERELAENPWSANPEAPRRPLQPHEPARANAYARRPPGDAIAETLATYTVGPAGLPAAFYGLGREGSELSHNLWNRDWGGAAENAGWLGAAFLAPGAKTGARGMKALERAKEIKAGTKGTPGERTEKAWEAGGQYGGWDELPVRMGASGPESEWVRWVPTFDPKKPPIAAFQEPSAPYERNWFGRYPREKAKGPLSELVNLNPELLKHHPDLADIPTTLKRSYGDNSGIRGMYKPPGWLFGERLQGRGVSNRELQEGVAHEIAHAMQHRNKWENGTNPVLEKRPWLPWGNDFRSYGDTAFRRYQENIGEAGARLDERLNTNKQYESYEKPATFPSYESLPAGERKRPGQKYSGMLQRSIDGKRPQDMPPSWQMDVEPKNLRAASGPEWAVLRALTKGGMVYGGIDVAGRLLDYMSKDAAERRNDESRAWAPRPARSSAMGKEMESIAGREDWNKIGNYAGAALHGSNAAINTYAGTRPWGSWWQLPVGVYSATQVPGYVSDARSAKARAERAREAKTAWDSLDLPDYPEMPLP